MSANPRLHPIFDFITKPLSEPDPMGPLKNYYASEIEKVAAERSVKRMNVKRLAESQIVELRPDFIDASEILDALETGMTARLESDGDDLPLEVRDAFDDLRKAMDKAAPYEPDAYDPADQYAGPEDDING